MVRETSIRDLDREVASVLRPAFAISSIAGLPVSSP
jgi:hypothetical protein